MYELCVCMFSFCMNLMYVIRCRLCFISQTICRLCLRLQTECILCYLSSSNGRAGVSMPVTILDSSSDGRMVTTHPSLLGATIATSVFCSSLLSYNCSNTLVATDRLPVAIMIYMFVVVSIFAYDYILIYFKFRFHRCVLCDEMNKIDLDHLHLF
jgi:hypothetical protein